MFLFLPTCIITSRDLHYHFQGPALLLPRTCIFSSWTCIIDSGPALSLPGPALLIPDLHYFTVSFPSWRKWIKPISEFDNGINLIWLLEYEKMAISRALSKNWSNIWLKGWDIALLWIWQWHLFIVYTALPGTILGIKSLELQGLNNISFVLVRLSFMWLFLAYSFVGALESFHFVGHD